MHIYVLVPVSILTVTQFASEGDYVKLPSWVDQYKMSKSNFYTILNVRWTKPALIKLSGVSYMLIYQWWAQERNHGDLYQMCSIGITV